MISDDVVRAAIEHVGLPYFLQDLAGGCYAYEINLDDDTYLLVGDDSASVRFADDAMGIVGRYDTNGENVRGEDVDSYDYFTTMPQLISILRNYKPLTHGEMK